jgi:hypothetical protein
MFGEFVVITAPGGGDAQTQRVQSIGRALLRWNELHTIAPFLFPFAFAIPIGAMAPLHPGFVRSCFGQRRIQTVGQKVIQSLILFSP